MTPRIEKRSVITSALLVVAVVPVFAALRDQGPQSTVTRYLGAVLATDSKREGVLILQDVKYPSADNLRAHVRNLAADPARFEIKQAFVLGRKAVVDVEFVRWDYGRYVLRVILAKPVVRWKVETQATWDYLNQGS